MAARAPKEERDERARLERLVAEGDPCARSLLAAPVVAVSDEEREAVAEAQARATRSEPRSFSSPEIHALIEAKRRTEEG
jgi:hypothetical protein